MLRWMLTHVVGPIVVKPVRRQLAAFADALRRPREVQEKLLREILIHQVATDYGREHRFQEIRTIDDYRRHVPIATYEAFERYIEQVRRGDFNALLADHRVHMFALTSGTTAARKFIPVTPRYLADYKRGWNLWGLKAFDDHPSIALRPILQMSGDWDEYRSEAGIPCGTVTGLTARMQKRIVRLVYCVPPCAGRIRDAGAKYYTALRLSMTRPLGMIIAANPSTLVNMARTGDREKESLIRDIHDGTLNPRIDIPAEVRSQLGMRFRRNPREARRLEEIVRRTGTLYPKDYWPEDCLLGNWTGGSVGAYMRHYPQYYGKMPVRDVGLIASEGRMTIPMRDGTASGVLDITSHFFEFVPENEIDSPNPIVLGAHEVEEGRNYFILPTTAFGLYRYHICDLVRVTGFEGATPLVEFLSKGAHFANLTGEKLSEYHVTQAMTQTLSEMNLTLTAYSLSPCWDDDQPFYGLFIEESDFRSEAHGQTLCEQLDWQLTRLNIEYAAKRQSLRLGPVRLQLLRSGAWQYWDRRFQVERGGTFEQYKHPCLIPDVNFRDTLISSAFGLAQTPAEPARKAAAAETREKIPTPAPASS
jgi:hypothetical protein